MRASMCKFPYCIANYDFIINGILYRYITDAIVMM